MIGERKCNLQDTLQKNKSGVPVGLFSICSANQYVIEAGMIEAFKNHSFVLIEATCNQVNQFGGYTGMTPLDFRRYVESIASKVGLDIDQVILGGDHLGPYPWRNMPADIAMKNSEQMVMDYAIAGYRKIHLDASMHCADDDPAKPLSKVCAAQRAVRMCRVIESKFSNQTVAVKPVYVIGTEVPIPGGQQDAEENIQITTIEDLDETISIHRNEFIKAGLESAWDRVVAVVVQPGVEFNENGIIEYDDKKSVNLKRYIKSIPGIVYEAHSTDYQTVDNLKKLVRDHFAILKVGPALTYNFREALIGLIHIEEHLVAAGIIDTRSNLLDTIKQVMSNNPKDWEDYLPKNQHLEIAKIFSYSDRIRYYWTDDDIRKSLGRLLKNLTRATIPLPMIKQYFPCQYWLIRDGLLKNTPEDIILNHIGEVITMYSQACNQ